MAYFQGMLVSGRVYQNMVCLQAKKISQQMRLQFIPMDLQLWVGNSGGWTCFSMEYLHLNLLRIAKTSYLWASGGKFWRSTGYGLLQPGCVGTFSVGASSEKKKKLQQVGAWGWLVGTKLNCDQDGWLFCRGALHTVLFRHHYKPCAL